ncbi:lipid-A-disaccharide synthase [bacterium]|nr:lipid-A-disaccharide synthase [bacterium]
MATDDPKQREIRLFVIAGENSGDIHAANLFRGLKRIYPRFRAWGLGGPQMESVGVKLRANIVEDLAIIGIVGVITNFPEIRRLFNDTVRFLERKRPDAILLVDYPGFNIRIAREAKRLGIPVIWYISPQIWAWHRSRLYTLAKLVDKMIVIFPFEVGLYKEENVDVVHVGHPLFDLVKIDMTREEVCAEFGLDPNRPIISIVPGSRRKEVDHFLQLLLEGAQRYHEMVPDTQFVIIRATTIAREQLEKVINRVELDFEPVIVDRLRYNMRNWSDFSWVKSGTSTLEAAILAAPMLIVYRVNFLTWVIGKQVFSIGHIGLPNIVAGDRIVPELLQDEFTPRNLAEKTHFYMTNKQAYDEMVADLAEVRDKLGGPGASEKAARAVLEVCGVDPIEAPQAEKPSPENQTTDEIE